MIIREDETGIALWGMLRQPSLCGSFSHFRDDFFVINFLGIDTMYLGQ
jgi:hypothetical protein